MLDRAFHQQHQKRVAFLQNSLSTNHAVALLCSGGACVGNKLYITPLTLTDGEISSTVKPCKSKCICLSLSFILSVFHLLYLLPSVFLVTDGHCKQLCVTGLVAWFLFGVIM